MKKLEVSLGDRSYPILIGMPLAKVGEALENHGFSSKALIVTNPAVSGLYGKRVVKSLEDAGFRVKLTEIPDGEKYKTLDTANQLYQVCMDFGLDRQSPILALGGGVIGDVAGFVASTFMRGLPLVMLPTTLLAQVDSSVGGKVGVNHPQSKNMIGSFYQPRLIYMDLDTLRTLPSREFHSGLAEVIKYGVIADKRFFANLERDMPEILSLNPERLEYIVWRSCQIKGWVVARDEKESGIRSWLNCGHTVGHAIEAASGYKLYQHGEALALGLLAEARLAQNLGMLTESWTKRIARLLGRAGLPTRLDPSVSLEKLFEAMQHDKKFKNGKCVFVLPERPGRVRNVEEISEEMVQAVLKELAA